jgi:hypothetical protein
MWRKKIKMSFWNRRSEEVVLETSVVVGLSCGMRRWRGNCVTGLRMTFDIVRHDTV